MSPENLAADVFFCNRCLALYQMTTKKSITDWICGWVRDSPEEGCLLWEFSLIAQIAVEQGNQPKHTLSFDVFEFTAYKEIEVKNRR